MNNELISVIVPAYNVEKCINKCVNSITNQTYSNLEIILVDDGSTDSTGKLCDEFKNKDKRIKVIHKENGGLSDARNAGIDKATGNYIIFIDSDDYVDLEIVEFLYNDLKINRANISTCLLKSFYENNNKDLKDMSENRSIILKTEEALENLMYTKDIAVSACAKLYEKILFEDIRFPKGKLYEDVATTYRLFAKAKVVSANSKKMYYYLTRKGSIMNSNFSKERMLSLYFARDETKFIKKYYPYIIKSAYCKEFAEAIFIIKEIPLKKEYANEIKDLKNVIKKYRNIICNDKKAPIKTRIYAHISYFGIRSIKIFSKTYKLISGGKRK